MIETTVLFCPKCKSQNVSTRRITPLKKNLVSMDDLAMFDPVQVVPLVLHTATWRATCDDCGYFVDYESY